MKVEDNVDTLWEGLKSVFNESAGSVVGKRKKRVKEWMSEDTIKTIEERKKIKDKINSTRSTRIAALCREENQTLNKEVKRKCRRDKRDNMNRMIQEAGDAATRGEQGTLLQNHQENQR